MPEESTAHHVRDLRFSMGGHVSFPVEFFEHTPWFTNVEKVTLMGHGMFNFNEPPCTSPLSQSIISLTFGPDTITTEPMQIRDITVHISSLFDFLISGPLARVDGETLLGIKTIMGGRFGGQLRLFGEHVTGGVVDMLLDSPTGLHFTELEIRSLCECLHSTVRLAEACNKTLVKLSYAVSFYREPHPFSSSSRFWCAKYRH